MQLNHNMITPIAFEVTCENTPNIIFISVCSVFSRSRCEEHLTTIYPQSNNHGTYESCLLRSILMTQV